NEQLQLLPADGPQRAVVGATPMPEAAVVVVRRARALADEPAVLAVAAPDEAPKPVLAVRVLLRHEGFSPRLERSLGRVEEVNVDNGLMRAWDHDPLVAR